MTDDRFMRGVINRGTALKQTQKLSVVRVGLVPRATVPTILLSLDNPLSAFYRVNRVGYANRQRPRVRSSTTIISLEGRSRRDLV